MSDMILIVLTALFGTLFGSFASVVISRLHTKEGGILTGTSHCPHCAHRLHAPDLVPLLSYIVCQGKCRYCAHPISALYPFLELLSGALWGYVMYSALLYNLSISATALLLALTWGFMVIAVYDIKYKEIPDHISVPMFLAPLLFLFITGGALVSGDTIVTTLYWTAGVYWFFVLQILLPGGAYFLKRAEYRNFFQLLWECLTFPIGLIISYFRSLFSKKENDETVSALPSDVIWMGEGDLRLALILGLTLWGLSIIALGTAYILGAVIWGSMLLFRKDLSHQIAFGPFLMVWWLAALTISPDQITGLLEVITTQ